MWLDAQRESPAPKGDAQHPLTRQRTSHNNQHAGRNKNKKNKNGKKTHTFDLAQTTDSPVA